MKKIILRFLLGGLILLILGWKTNILPELSSKKEIRVKLSPVESVFNSEVVYSASNPENSEQNTPRITIDPEYLWHHLEALVGERYREDDRQLTRDYLVEQLQRFGFSTFLQSFDSGINIIAEQPGSNSKAGTILIAAHYDTVANSPGADDNASGIAVVLEVARLFSSISTPHPLKIVFFDQEELGLLGSFAFTSLAENLTDLHSVIILDMVGYACHTPGCQQYPPGLNIAPLLQASGVNSPDQGEFLVVVGEVENRELLQVFRSLKSANSQQNNAQNIASEALSLPPVVTVPIPLKGLLTPDALRSDHAPFWYQGIPAVLVTDTANLRSPHYHQPTDTLSHLDRDFLMGSAQVIVNTITQLLANSDKFIEQ